ncbi:UV-stimulated scaffold protein A homolog [Neltuma alba]|uniref:UV-stimulated scaffold protein A homolog n=1 Tax=Neltuma alba TaxID=207710 RepID=UPI0010A38427|nr:UV-stimulated scaffold protein A homolog [Prosopis alba]
MEEEERRGRGTKVRSLIEKATTSTSPEVDPRLLRAIKSVVRFSDSELRIAAETLTDLMKRDHSQVRYLTLLIIDELFMRSKLFRTLLVENLDHLLSLSIGFRRNLPLPAPPAVASVLRSKAIEFLEKWNHSFGIHYRQLRLGHDYLKNTLRLQFPNIQANVERMQQERRERERRSKEILLNKYEHLRQNLSSIKGEILSTVDEIGECLEILNSTEDFMQDDILDDEVEEFFGSSELRQMRLDAIKEGEKVHENSDNKVIFDALRELYKLLVTKHLISVQEWISVLVRVEVADNRFRDSTLKEFIDIRNHLKSVQKKCEEAGCSLQNSSKHSEEEDFWEEGNVVANEVASRAPKNKDIHLDMASTTHKVNGSALSSRDKESNSSNAKCLAHGRNEVDSNSPRSELLAEAPVVRWSSHLDDWGSSRVFMANQRGLELENHWGRVDSDAVIPADKIAELNVHAALYEEKQEEIQPCRAPLRKGGLCQRRDLRVCPFHGPILPRDDEGKPLNQSTSEHKIDDKGKPLNQSTSEHKMDDGGKPLNQSTSEHKVNVDLGIDLAEHLAKQAVKNVREIDEEVAKKRKIDKQTMKRAKLAKIREHNKSVLRNAALASTSRSASLGQDGDVTNEGNLSSRDNKRILASMLRKKVTSKDRIAGKLLSSRARDATTRQHDASEDAKYREAFPNQW